MPYVVDRMTLTDIPRVVEIERLAYTTPWPSSAYRKELQDNPLAHYIVARDTRLNAVPATLGPGDSLTRRPFPFSLLPARPIQSAVPELASIIGFAGLWLMVDEAHVTTIAVHPSYRGRGIGELMLSTLIGIAYDIHARQVTLEVRVSNSVAQNLYHKYGFKEAGVRKRYYSDNHEDAYIMWTEEIQSPGYRERFARLSRELRDRFEHEAREEDVTRRDASGER